MYRLKLLILAVIVAFMMLHLYFIGNKSIVEPIGYSGSIKVAEHSEPMNNINALRFPSYKDKKYIYAFILDEDKLNYKRYDIENGKEVSINLPKNKNLIICAEEKSIDKASWSWHSNFIDLNLKGKFAKSVNDVSVGPYRSFLKEVKGERTSYGYFQFIGENKGAEKISLVYGEQIKDYIKIPVTINVE
jgi:hypothetical protein